MDKAIVEKLKDFKQRKVNNLKLEHQKQSNVKYRIEDTSIRREFYEWLRNLANYNYADDVAKTQIDEYIENIYCRFLECARTEEKIEILITKNTSNLNIEDEYQIAALLDADLAKKVKQLIKIGRNYSPKQKGFLNIFSCKFRKSKMQQSESQKDTKEQKSNN